MDDYKSKARVGDPFSLMNVTNGVLINTCHLVHSRQRACIIHNNSNKFQISIFYLIVPLDFNIFTQLKIYFIQTNNYLYQ